MRKQLLLAAAMSMAAVVPAIADDDDDDRRRPRGYPVYRDDRDYRYDRNRGYGNDRYRRNDGYGAYSRQYPGGNAAMAAMRDLDMIYRRARVDSHESNHFRRALSELNDFNRDAARGNFDRGSLDSAISNMADLAQADQLHPRDRQIIARHLNSLRYMRNSGYRY